MFLEASCYSKSVLCQFIENDKSQNIKYKSAEVLKDEPSFQSEHKRVSND